MITQNKAPALERGLQIIEYIAKKQTPTAFNELVQELSIPKATAVRLLAVLVDHGYLRKNSVSGHYELSARSNLFGKSNSIAEELQKKGKKIVKKISQKTSNTVILFYWNGFETQVLCKEMHPDSLVMQALGNTSKDFINTPWGWILVQHRHKNEILDEDTAKFIKSKEYQKAMDWYETNGFTYENRKKVLRRIATPIIYKGAVVGALGLGGNSLTMPDSKIMEFGNLLKQYAGKIL
jgi:DNA-binding IclR family transcriptional regulator